MPKSTRPMIRIHDLATNEEIELMEAESLAAAELKAQLETEAEAKAIAKQAVLDKLGLSAQEVATLLG